MQGYRSQQRDHLVINWFSKFLITSLNITWIKTRLWLRMISFVIRLRLGMSTAKPYHGFFPFYNTSALCRDRPVSVPREHILKYLANTNTRINDLRTLGVSGLATIQHCFPRPSPKQGNTEERKEASKPNISIPTLVGLCLDAHGHPERQAKF